MATISVQENQKVLVLKKEIIYDIIPAGNHFYYSRDYSFSFYDLSDFELKDCYKNSILRNHPRLMDEHFNHILIKENQVGILYKKEKAIKILLPEDYLFWKELDDLEVQIIDLNGNPEVDESFMKDIKMILSKNQSAIVKSQVYYDLIENHEIGILKIDGEANKILKSGEYAFWLTLNHKISIDKVDCRQQQIEVSGQEILTKDKISLRINAEAYFQITDPLKLQNLYDWQAYIYKEVQFILRDVVGQRTLDEILSDKSSANQEALNLLKPMFEKAGVEILRIGIKDIILPGEMRDLVNKVISAEKTAQANIIRRREETSATRSLLNTAKLMEENPILMRLKEMELLEKAFNKTHKININDGIEQLLKLTR